MTERWLAVALAFAMFISVWPGQISSQASSDTNFGFEGYHGYEDIKTELERLSSEHPGIAQKLNIGRTWEGREIMALRVTDNPDVDEADEPDILIMGAHHANELPSAEVPMYILEFLVGSYSDNYSVRDLVDSRDIWFVPLVNPDGREYAMNHDMSWRKNRRDNGDGSFGVDLNRNYGHLWGELPGTSHNPADPNYCGPSAFSENETGAVRNLVLSQNISISLSYHTFGELIYYPWNNNIDTVSPKLNLLEAIAEDLGELTGYTPMNGVDAYPTTGDSDDWLYSATNCLPFTIELGTQYAPLPGGLGALCSRNLDAALYAIDLAKEPAKALLPDWTVMVYMSADADIGLADEALVDLNEMEAAGSTPDMNIIALLDGRGTGDSAIYHVQKDPGGFNAVLVSPALDDMGAVIDPISKELDMSNPATLADFASWAMGEYPAQRYLLSLWGHGDGVLKGFLPDKGVAMRTGDIHTALAGLKLDIVGFDTCSMGHFEVADELAGIAGIMIGSEAKEPLAGWDYRTTLARLALKPGTGARALAGQIVADYLAANHETYLTQAAIDLRIYSELFLPLFNEFSDVSLDFAYKDYAKAWQARNISNTFVAEQDAVDLFQYLGNLRSGNVSAPVAERIDRLLQIRDGMILASGTGTAFPNSRAMAVLFPTLESAILAEYFALGFCANRWDEYLRTLKNPDKRPFIIPGQPIGANSTAGPYEITAEVSDYGGETVILNYRVNGGAWMSAAMLYGGGTLSSEVPGQANGSLVEYYFLDRTNNITEPYEVKWGGADFLFFDVGVFCDLGITGFFLLTPEPIRHGNVTVFLVNCYNAGPESALANVTLRLNSTPSGAVVGVQTVNLDAGGSASIRFNWTAELGNWTMAAEIGPASVPDMNPGNDFMLLRLNVSAKADGVASSQYWVALLGVALIWMVTLVAAIHIMKKSKLRRRSAVGRSIMNARDFIRTAEEFGGESAEAGILLARAEAALAGNRLSEAEGLVREARQCAMNALAANVPEGGLTRKGT